MPDTQPAVTLASASPRRRELLGALSVRFRTAASDAEEQDHPPPPALADALPALDLPPLDHPTLRAWRKADAACAHAPGGVIIGADTVVALGREVLNKPLDAADARRMLRRLAGRTHTVYTGLCVLAPTGDRGPQTIDRRAKTADDRPTTEDQRPQTLDDQHSVKHGQGLVHGPRSTVHGRWSVLLDLVATEVAFQPLTDAEIAAYVASGEPLDKAGAYGVQGLGGQLISAVSGSYTNVVGLPLVQAHRLLAAAGVAGLADPAAAYRRWLATQGKEPLPCPPTFP
jgi:septum formation protein